MDDLLTVPQAAKLCGVEARTVHYWLDREKLPIAKTEQHGERRVRLIRRSDLIERGYLSQPTEAV